MCYMTNNTYISTLHDFSHKIYFYCWKKSKKYIFSPKMAWPSATYDVISRNQSNWLSLNLSQNVREGWTSRYWKLQVLMFYPLRKKTQKNFMGTGGGGSVQNSCDVVTWNIKHSFFLFHRMSKRTSRKDGKKMARNFYQTMKKVLKMI